MILRPASWSVIIVGRWNRAILTPAGIAKRVFGLEDEKQLMVAVPLDGISPYQVRHPAQNIIAMTDETRLRIDLAEQNYEALAYAMESGVKALTSLPETPVSAAGFNVNFLAAEITTEFAAMLAADIDAKLVGIGGDIVTRTLSRSIEYGAGRLNITIGGERKGYRLACNFHRSSKKVDELKQWLETSVNDIKEAINKLLRSLDLDIEEVTDGIDEK